jgi:pimeloyl-ACP methyl ester carboxylesterase
LEFPRLAVRTISGFAPKLRSAPASASDRFATWLPADPPAQAGDLHQGDGQTAHLQCQGAGSPTLVFLGGRGFTTTTWAKFRAALGPDVRTCAWDYSGVGHSTGAPMMTAARAASSLDGTLSAAKVPRRVILVGHSVAGLTTRLYVGQHPADVAGVVLFDPTVASFARTFDDKEFRPDWDGTTSAHQAEQVTTWPDIPFEILRHDPAVYAAGKGWSKKVETLWGADQAAFATLAPHGTTTVVHGSGHNVYQDAQAVSVAAVRRVLGAVSRSSEWPRVSQFRRHHDGPVEERIAWIA